MSTDDSKALVPQGSGSLSRIKPRRTNPIMQRMTRDILALLEEQNRLEQVRFTLGDYEFREPDYQQILRWAEAWGRSAEEVLEKLVEPVFEDYCPERQIMFTVLDGRIHSLVWDYDEISPAKEWTWHEGLAIETLVFQSVFSFGCLPIHLPVSLQTLYCQQIELEELDLSPMPNLTMLDCSGNQLTTIALSSVPNLKILDCGHNPLTALDLSPVPDLTELACYLSPLTTLDLSPVPNLTTLSCGMNQLTELHLSPGPNLTILRCFGNELTYLDLSPVPNLTTLLCHYNQLTELDLSPVPNLTVLWCHNNPLTNLDIRPLTNLEELLVDETTRLIGTLPPGCKVEYK